MTALKKHLLHINFMSTPLNSFKQNLIILKLGLADVSKVFLCAVDSWSIAVQAETISSEKKKISMAADFPLYYSAYCLSWRILGGGLVVRSCLHADFLFDSHVLNYRIFPSLFVT